MDNHSSFREKIQSFNIHQLYAILQLKGKISSEEREIVQEELQKRGLEQIPAQEQEDLVSSSTQLKKWNWAAFLLTPLWAFANKLDGYGVLSCIPGMNIIIMFYLGFKGNVLAFKKSKLKSVQEFNQVQKIWEKWTIFIFAILLMVGLLKMVLRLF